MRAGYDWDAWTGFIMDMMLVTIIISIMMNHAVNKSDTTVTWVTIIPVDAGARKLSLQVGIRADGVLVGALSTPASAATNIKGEQTP
jgi:hypothetical protein